MNPNVASYFDGIEDNWTYWTFENLTNSGSGTLFTQGVCTVLGGSLAVVGIAVAGVAAAIFGTMALGPVGLALAGMVTLGIAAGVALTILAVMGAAGNTLLHNAFAGNGGMRRIYEWNEAGLTKLYKEEFHATMKSSLARHYETLLEDLKTATVEQREDLEEKYKKVLDEDFETQFPGLDPEDVKGKELSTRMRIEKALFILAIYNKLGIPDPAPEE